MLAACLMTGCAATGRPPAPAPGTTTLTGTLDLEPPPAAGGARGRAGYGDRRMRDAVPVDYSRPGFAVVYVDLRVDLEDDVDPSEAAPTPVSHAIEIADGSVGVHIDPATLALRSHDRIELRNSGRRPHTISIPSLGVVRGIEPGERIAITVEADGDHTLHLLDDPRVSARIFAAPGPYSRVSEAGRFTIADVPPGRHDVHVWHPRLPPSHRVLDFRADTIEHVDLALGLDVRRDR